MAYPMCFQRQEVPVYGNNPTERGKKLPALIAMQTVQAETTEAAAAAAATVAAAKAAAAKETEQDPTKKKDLGQWPNGSAARTLFSEAGKGAPKSTVSPAAVARNASASGRGSGGKAGKPSPPVPPTSILMMLRQAPSRPTLLQTPQTMLP